MGKMNSLTINGKRYDEFNGAGGSGGVSSWNDLADKPFYVKEEGWEITFDPEAYTEPPAGSVQMSDTTWYVRVSDRTPSNEELKKCSATLVAINPDNPDEKVTQTAALSTMWDRYEAQGMITDEYANCEFGIIVRDVAAVNEMVGAGVFTMTGTYFMVVQNSQYLSKLTKPYDVQTLDPMFLPNTLIGKPGDGVGAEMFNTDGVNTHIASGDYSHVEGVMNVARGEAVHVEGARNETLGRGCHVEGGYNTALGDYVHAEGYETAAGGFAVHAEGLNTRVSGEGAHGEGHETFAIGEGAHAEGTGTSASGDGAHAEGHGGYIDLLLSGAGPTYNLVSFKHTVGKAVIGACAHYTDDNGVTRSAKIVAISDELMDPNYPGYPKTITLEHSIGDFSEDAETVHVYNSYAEGYGAHCEGEYTKADGHAAHAEGVGTIAHYGQHVQGRYNIEDTESKYAHIVGNGSDTYPDGIVRSNAHTVDWDGNGWYAGTVEATGIILKSSTPGSTKRFLLTVYDNGQPNVAEITE